MLTAPLFVTGSGREARSSRAFRSPVGLYSRTTFVGAPFVSTEAKKVHTSSLAVYEWSEADPIPGGSTAGDGDGVGSGVDVQAAPIMTASRTSSQPNQPASVAIEASYRTAPSRQPASVAGFAAAPVEAAGGSTWPRSKGTGVMKAQPDVALPLRPNGIVSDCVVGRQDHEPVDDRLADEHAVEGVAMKVRQSRELER